MSQAFVADSLMLIICLESRPLPKLAMARRSRAVDTKSLRQTRGGDPQRMSPAEGGSSRLRQRTWAQDEMVKCLALLDTSRPALSRTHTRLAFHGIRPLLYP